MRIAGLSTHTLFLSLQIASGYAAIICSSNGLENKQVESDFSSITKQVSDLIINFCSKAANQEQSQFSQQEEWGIVFEVVRTSPSTSEECTNSLTEIISECIEVKKVNGGQLKESNGNKYSVHHEGHGRLQKRAKAKGKPNPNPPVAPKSKAKPVASPKPKQTPAVAPSKPAVDPKSKSNPTPGGQQSKSAADPKQKSTSRIAQSNTKTGTSTRATTKTSSARSSSTASSTPTKACKAIYAEALKQVKAEAAGLEKANIEKRTTPKRGTSCKRNLNALPYPQVHEMPAGAKYYHFSQPQVCSNVIFPAGSPNMAPGMVQDNYDIEHVLEWQVVTKFFDWVSDTKKRGQKLYKHPRPGSSLDQTFCQYWLATWDETNSPNPFQLNGRGPTLRALDHLRNAYPSATTFPDEFIYLQKTVNSPAKSVMWGHFENAKPGVYSDDTTSETKSGARVIHRGMTDLIRGHPAKGRSIPATPANINDARIALLKLKWLMGARMYLRKAAIEVIFTKQVNRIGAVLDALDSEMVNQPKSGRTGGQWTAWQPQGLKSLWDEYMLEKFETAKSRCSHDLDKYVKLLDQTWAPKGQQSSDRNRVVFYAEIQKLKNAWAAEKKRTWVAPWTKSRHAPPAPPPGTPETV